MRVFGLIKIKMRDERRLISDFADPMKWKFEAALHNNAKLAIRNSLDGKKVVLRAEAIHA